MYIVNIYIWYHIFIFHPSDFSQTKQTLVGCFLLDARHQRTKRVGIGDTIRLLLESCLFLEHTLQEINISHLGKFGKSSSNMPLKGDMLIPWRVSRCAFPHDMPTWNLLVYDNEISVRTFRFYGIMWCFCVCESRVDAFVSCRCG